MRCHSARIASELLSCPDGDKYRAGLFAYVDSATELLLAHHNVHTVHVTAAAAQTHRRLETNADETRLAAKGYLRNLKEPKRLDAIMESACQNERLIPEALDLLRQAGPHALSRVLQGRADRGWPALKPVFPILRQLPDAETIPILTRLLEHEQLAVRRETLKSLWEIDERPESVEPYLRRAIADENSRIEFDAIQRLAQQNTTHCLDLLCAYVEGQLSHRLPSLYHYRQAVNLLIDRGEAARNHLCAVLRSLCKSPRKAKWAKIIADTLKSQRDVAEVKKTLKVWRLSPARVSLFLQKVARGLLRRSKHD